MDSSPSIGEHFRVAVASLLVYMTFERATCSALVCGSLLPIEYSGLFVLSGEWREKGKEVSIRDVHSSANAVRRFAGSLFMQIEEAYVPICATDLLSMTFSEFPI
jgi:hypothetical protein